MLPFPHWCKNVAINVVKTGHPRKSVLDIGYSFREGSGGNANINARSSRMMKKLMTGSNRSRRKFFLVEQPISKSLKEFGFMSNKTSSSGQKNTAVRPIRRVEVLNTVFIEQITSLMSTGEVAFTLTGLGIEVSKVKVSSDFSCVNVYWVAKGTAADAFVEEALSKAAGHLRHELTQLRIIGQVPPIKFIKDKTYSKIAEVESLLAICDFGEDFVPTTSANYFQPLTSAGTKAGGVSSQLSEQIQSMEFSSSLSQKEEQCPVDDEMRQDMLGLDHTRILNEVMLAVSRNNEKIRAKIKEREVLDVDGPIAVFPQASEQVTNDLNEFEEDKKRNDEFLKYLQKRRATKARAEKQKTTAAKEKEFYESQRLERWLDSQNYFKEEEEDDHPDFLDEEEYSQTYDDFLKNS